MIYTVQSGWFTDFRDVVDVGLLLIGAAMSIVGYKVHAVLFDLKIPERMATLEKGHEDHEKRIDKIETKIFFKA